MSGECCRLHSLKYLHQEKIGIKIKNKNMLKDNGPSMGPCRTPRRTSDHELYVPFNFTLLFPLINYECNIFREGISTP